MEATRSDAGVSSQFPVPSSQFLGPGCACRTTREAGDQAVQHAADLSCALAPLRRDAKPSRLRYRQPVLQLVGRAASDVEHWELGTLSFSDPCIITNSISGVVANREQCPAIPYTPEEYGEEARRVVEEGASMIHIHARKPDGSPSFEIEDFRNITEAILGAVDDVVINYSTGAIGIPIEKRLEYLRELR